MSNQKKDQLNASRRKFINQTALASIGIFIGGKSALANIHVFSPAGINSKINGVQIGTITYSFRSMPGSVEQTLQYCVDAGISAIELMGDAAEVFAGAPENPIKWVPGQKFEMTEEKKLQIDEYQKTMANWRKKVSMDPFIAIRKMYNKAGVSIYAFKPNALNPNNTDAEIEYACKAGKALGAKSVTVELPTNLEHAKRLGDLASKNDMLVGYHAHTQATDDAWDQALMQSPNNSINLDCGHYIAAGGANTKDTLLAFINKNHARISSMHIKDRLNKDHGGNNKPWGEGDTPLKEILTLLKEKKYPIPATIELEYDIPAGSDAVKEVKKCFAYTKAILS
jgi:sugar phosphate isomerase/epimerase